MKAEFATKDVKVDKLQISSDDKIAVELSNSTAIPDTKLSFKGTDASRAAGAGGIAASVGAEYKKAGFVGTFDLNVIDTAVLPAEATATFTYTGFTIGGQVKTGLLKRESVEFDALFAYKNKSTTAGIQTSKSLANATASIYQAVNPELTVAGQADFPLFTDKAAGKAPGKVAVQVGLAYKLSADATAHVKANQAGKVSASYAHVLSPLAKLSLATELDAANLASDDHKFGIQLALSA